MNESIIISDKSILKNTFKKYLAQENKEIIICNIFERLFI